jgi:hypothetical protein
VIENDKPAAAGADDDAACIRELETRILMRFGANRRLTGLTAWPRDADQAALEVEWN